MSGLGPSGARGALGITNGGGFWGDATAEVVAGARVVVESVSLPPPPPPKNFLNPPKKPPDFLLLVSGEASVVT